MQEEQKQPQKLRAHLFFFSSIILYMFKNLSEESQFHGICLCGLVKTIFSQWSM